MEALVFFLLILTIVLIVLLLKTKKQVSDQILKELANKSIGELRSELSQLEENIKKSRIKDAAVKSIEDLVKILDNHKLKIQALNDLETIQKSIQIHEKQLSDLTKATDVIDVGFYSARYSFDTSEKYKAKLEEIRKKQKTMIEDDKAAVSNTQWQVRGSDNEGQKLMKNIIKLVLRAFNGECDTIIAKVKFGNVVAFEEKIRKSKDAINKLCEKWDIEITDDYVNLMIEELRLVYEYQEKLEQEKEEQRLIKEQMREEEKALRELEKAKQDAEKEEQRYQDAINKAKKELHNKQGKELEELNAQLRLLEQQLAEAHAKKERALSQAQLTKSGHVYIISNIGSFGENIYKIGMTRRLEPLDRVKELGDASVPFEFDVHAIIYSDNAPEMENQLHKIFNNHRVNLVNEKREFFNVSIDEIKNAVKNIHKDFDRIEFRILPDAKEYRQSLSMRESLN